MSYQAKNITSLQIAAHEKHAIDRLAWKELDGYSTEIDYSYDPNMDIRKGQFSRLLKSPLAGAVIDVGMQTATGVGFGLGITGLAEAVGVAGKCAASKPSGKMKDFNLKDIGSKAGHGSL